MFENAKLTLQRSLPRRRTRDGLRGVFLVRPASTLGVTAPRALVSLEGSVVGVPANSRVRFDGHDTCAAWTATACKIGSSCRAPTRGSLCIPFSKAGCEALAGPVSGVGRGLESEGRTERLLLVSLSRVRELRKSRVSFSDRQVQT